MFLSHYDGTRANSEMTIQFATFLFLGHLLVVFNVAQSCSCALSDFQVRYYENLKRGAPFSEAFVVLSWLRNTGPVQQPGSGLKIQPSFGQKRVYKLRVTRVYADCAPMVPYYTFAVSSTSSAA